MDNSTEASKEIMRKARAKYLRDKVDTIALRVPKGYKEIISNHAKMMEESVNAFISRAIAETIENDGPKSEPSK